MVCPGTSLILNDKLGVRKDVPTELDPLESPLYQLVVEKMTMTGCSGYDTPTRVCRLGVSNCPRSMPSKLCVCKCRINGFPGPRPRACSCSTRCGSRGGC